MRQTTSSTSETRANVFAFLAHARGLGQARGLGKIPYGLKQPAASSPGAAPGQSLYDIVPGGSCASVGGVLTSYGQDKRAQSIFGQSTRLTFDQLKRVVGSMPTPVRESGGTGDIGWYIGGGSPEPAYASPDGCVGGSGGFLASGRVGGCQCVRADLAISSWKLATPDGGLVQIPSGVYTRGMKWDDLVEPAAPPPPVSSGGGSIVSGAAAAAAVAAAAAAAAAANQPAACSQGYARPPAGGHTTCNPGYGWIVDPAGTGCETCAPLCATGWLTPDQAPPACPAGEYMVRDPRTQCVKCIRGSNCFKPGENPVQCPAPFALEARGEYTCCVVPAQAPQPVPQSQAQSAPVAAPVQAEMSTGAKVAIGGAVLLGLALIFKKKG